MLPRADYLFSSLIISVESFIIAPSKLSISTTNVIFSFSRFLFPFFLLNGITSLQIYNITD